MQYLGYEYIMCTYVVYILNHVYIYLGNTAKIFYVYPSHIISFKYNIICTHFRWIRGKAGTGHY